MIINSQAYTTERFKFSSTLDPRDFADYQEWERVISRHMYEWEVEQHNRVNRRQAQQQDSIVHILISPPISTDPKEIKYGSEVTVKANHFSAFCTAYHLDEPKMLQVSTGTLKEYHGWTRSTKLSPMIYGSPYSAPKVPMSPGEKRKRELELAADKKRQADINYKTPTSAPPITFNPDAPQPLAVPSTTEQRKPSLFSNPFNR